MDIMASNVFTKKEILQQLASKGYFIDIYTLDAFFAKKKVEAVFEDSQGNEFYDQNAINTVLEGLFSVAQNHSQALLENSNTGQTTSPEPVQTRSSEAFNTQTNEQNILSNNTEVKLDDSEAVDILSGISLSDGTPLINKVQDVQNIEPAENNPPAEIIQEKQNETFEAQNAAENNVQAEMTQNSYIQPQVNEIYTKDELFDSSRDEIFSSDIPLDNDEGGSFDDVTLLSESLEAQEKLRQYVVSELSKKNLDVTPQQQQTSSSLNNEFKLDISERTLNMIARTMAKKIAKYVGSIMAADAKQSSKVAEFQEENRRLTQKTRELEEQNRKLRLLLAESNKNLNSYKPSIFGLYKKIDPKQGKK